MHTKPFTAVKLLASIASVQVLVVGIASESRCSCLPLRRVLFCDGPSDHRIRVDILQDWVLWQVPFASARAHLITHLLLYACTQDIFKSVINVYYWNFNLLFRHAWGRQILAWLCIEAARRGKFLKHLSYITLRTILSKLCISACCSCVSCVASLLHRAHLFLFAIENKLLSARWVKQLDLQVLRNAFNLCKNSLSVLRALTARPRSLWATRCHSFNHLTWLMTERSEMLIAACSASVRKLAKVCSFLLLWIAIRNSYILRFWLTNCLLSVKILIRGRSSDNWRTERRYFLVCSCIFAPRFSRFVFSYLSSRDWVFSLSWSLAHIAIDRVWIVIKVALKIVAASSVANLVVVFLLRIVFWLVGAHINTATTAAFLDLWVILAVWLFMLMLLFTWFVLILDNVVNS